MRKLGAAISLALIVALLGTTAAVLGTAGGTVRYGVKSTELMIPSRGIQIPATMVLPVGTAAHEKFPLVVIHHGHGGGRNENGGLTRVADALAHAGIASIRFDFAGAGDSKEPFTKLSYTTMLADSSAALTYAVRHFPIDTKHIGGFGYSEGSAVVAMQAGLVNTPYQAVALLGPLAHPTAVFETFFGGAAKFQALYAEAQQNGYAVVTTPFGQVQNTSLEWFQETIAANPTKDISYFRGRVEILWGTKDQIIPYREVSAYVAATRHAKRTTVVKIADADHGYGFYSNQPKVDAALHAALVAFFTKALK